MAVKGVGDFTRAWADFDSYVELWQFDELAIKFGDLCRVQPRAV